MDQIWVRNYLKQYLIAHQCHIIEEGPGHMTVKLSVETDKDLMNRPYYWTFVERTGAPAETTTVTFILQPDHLPEEIRGEDLRFGSERLKQIFNSAKKRGRMIRLYQQFQPKNRLTEINRLSLDAWLGVNFKIEFISDKKKDRILSLGINLRTGKMKGRFFGDLLKTDLSPVLPANVSIVPSLLTIREAALQLEQWILHEIDQEDFNWAKEAKERLDQEIHQLETYYQKRTETENTAGEKNQTKSDGELLQEDDEKEKKIEETKWQYSPRIEINPINYGIFYLNEIVQ